MSSWKSDTSPLRHTVKRVLFSQFTRFVAATVAIDRRAVCRQRLSLSGARRPKNARGQTHRSRVESIVKFYERNLYDGLLATVSL